MTVFGRGLMLAVALLVPTVCPAMAADFIGEGEMAGGMEIQMGTEMGAMVHPQVESPAMDCCLQMPGQGRVEHEQMSTIVPRSGDGVQEIVSAVSVPLMVCDREERVRVQAHAAPPPRAFANWSVMRRE